MSNPLDASPTLDATDRWLLDRVQQGIPLCPKPWAELGRGGAPPDGRSLTGEEVLSRLIRLKQAKIIRQISPIFDTVAMGYSSMLVAARVPEERLDAAAAVVSRHPGVSHNYRRDAEFNLWFTLAVPPGQRIEEHLARLTAEAGLEACHPLPALRTFRIGVRLDVSGEEPAEAEIAAVPSQPLNSLPDGDTGPKTMAGGTPAPPAPAPPEKKSQPRITLTDFDKQVIRLTQGDLPLVDRPYDDYCRQLGVDFAALRGWMERMRQAGVLRRIAAILHHRRVGFMANGMGVWRIDEAQMEEAGRRVIEFREVSHCYQRAVYPDWPYNFYTMIHAPSRAACDAVVARLAARLGDLLRAPPRVLYSSTEYKKSRLRYFDA